MPRSCWLTRSGSAGRAEWSLDDETLVLTPEGRAPEPYPIRELAGIGGDEYSMELRIGDGTCTLSRLGSDGPGLLDRLQRLWLPQRAAALCIAGTGEGRPYAGSVTRDGTCRAFRALLFDDLLALAPHAEDVEPLFLALQEKFAFDESRYAITVTAWDGTAIELGKLGGETQALFDALRTRRAAIAEQAGKVLAAHLPTLPLAPRARLAAAWLLGRMLTLEELEAAAPGSRGALAASWIGALPRKAQAETLLAWGEPGKFFVGYSRPDAAPQAESEADAAPAQEAGGEVPAGDREAAEEAPAPAPAQPPDILLWLLAGRGRSWLLEELSVGDHATYHFEAGAELPGLASRLLCAPQFSREALYLPLEKLVVARAELDVTARDLPFLRALRERYRERIIHSSPDAWQHRVSAVR
jgi:hypothetical protein